MRPRLESSRPAPAGAMLGGALYGLAALTIFALNPQLRGFLLEQSITLRAGRGEG